MYEEVGSFSWYDKQLDLICQWILSTSWHTFSSSNYHFNHRHSENNFDDPVKWFGSSNLKKGFIRKDMWLLEKIEKVILEKRIIF